MKKVADGCQPPSVWSRSQLVAGGAIAHQPAGLMHKMASVSNADGDPRQTNRLIGWARGGDLSRIHCLHRNVLRPGAVRVQHLSGAVNRRGDVESIHVPDVR